MCQMQQLYLAEQGFVVRCPDCGTYQLGFGNIMLSLNKADFSYFKKLLAFKQEEWAFQQNALLKNIVIPTPCGKVQVLLCRKELADWNQVLDTAESEEIALELLELFNA